MRKINRRRMLQMASLTALGKGAHAFGLQPSLADPGIVSPHDLMLWFKKPASAWTEALPMGNGRLGGMVWGGVREERVDLNDDTLWSGEPYDNVNPRGLKALPRIRELLVQGDDQAAQKLVEEALNGRYNQSYLPLGTLFINFPMKEGETSEYHIEGYQRSLDLKTGISATSFARNGIRYTREVFASRPDDVLVVRLEADRPASVSGNISLSTQLRGTISDSHGMLLLAGRVPANIDPSYVQDGSIQYDEGPSPRGMRFACMVKAVHQGGSISFRDNALVAEQCDSVTLLLTAATSYNGPHRSPSTEGRDEKKLCNSNLEKVAEKSYAQLRTQHVADHGGLFKRVSIDLGTSHRAILPTDERLHAYRPGTDPALLALYAQFGRYLLIAASRPGTQPSNLQGIWNKDLRPAWSANWTLNCNAQINYWPVEVANLAECHAPLLELTRELSIDGANVASHLYGVRGWVAHHNTDIWRQAAPVSGSAKWSIFQVGSAWLCQHLWEHYAFSQDSRDLLAAWPTISQAARFYLDDLMTEPSHGWLVTGPDTNFENPFRRPDGHVGSVCMGPTGSMQMVRQLFMNVMEASRKLELGQDLRDEIEAALPKLPPMQVSPTTGELQEWIEDWQRTADPQVLSSWGAVCAAQITPRSTPALAAGLKKIFDTGKWWQQGLTGSWEGAFQANVYARLHDGDTALSVLDTHIGRSVNPNFTANFGLDPIGRPNPTVVEWQIDGNLGLTAAVFEMLFQSHAGEIHLLPALPAAWLNGSVRGLRARGGCVAELYWREGQLRRVRLHSKSGGQLQLRYQNTVVFLSLAAGQTITLDGQLKTNLSNSRLQI